MCLSTNDYASLLESPDPFVAKYEVWSRLSDAWNAAYDAQSEAQAWNEVITDEIGSMVEAALERALKTIPQTLPGLALYISMLEKRGAAACPEVIEIALVTLRRTIEDLMARE